MTGGYLFKALIYWTHDNRPLITRSLLYIYTNEGKLAIHLVENMMCIERGQSSHD